MVEPDDATVGERPARDSDAEGEHRHGASRLEWAVGLASTAIVLVVVGYLFFQALTRPSTPPMITVDVENVLEMPSGFLLRIRARNEGSATAANVTVQGTLLRDTTRVETSTATIDFVPAQAGRDGGLYFTRDPRDYRLELRPLGYDQP